MSANLVVDIANTCNYDASVMVGSGSNLVVGNIVDLLNANTYCNVWIATAAGSGAVEARIQTSDSLTSGSFTDPTSGLSSLPVNVMSGGCIFANSGIWASGYGPYNSVVDNSVLSASGGIFYGAFQRPNRYARLILNSGSFPSWITAGFISQLKTTGSGFGYSWQPQSGTTINV